MNFTNIGNRQHKELVHDVYYRQLVVDIINTDLEPTVIKDVLFSAQVWKITREMILEGDLDICKYAEFVDDLIVLERILDLNTLKHFINFILPKSDNTFKKHSKINSLLLQKFYNLNGTKAQAYELYQVIIQNLNDFTAEHLSKCLEIWSSKRVISIGSSNQHEYLTYIARWLMKKTQKCDRADIHSIREGIQLRLNSTNKELVNHAHVIWDTYSELCKIDPSTRMLTEKQLKDFDEIKSAEIEIKPEPETDEEQKDPNQFYASSDSDNDSDFTPFETEDDPSDLQFVTKPQHLYDLYIALTSEDFERFNLAVKHASELIRKNLPNLDSTIIDIIQALFRIEDKFNKGDFEVLKGDAIRA
jgi:hypothetical protein